MARQTEPQTTSETSILTNGLGQSPASPPIDDERVSLRVEKEANGARDINGRQTREEHVEDMPAVRPTEEARSLAKKSLPGTCQQSLRMEVIDYIKPKISDPSILHASNAISILEDFVSNRLSTLEGTEEIHQLAKKIILNEIERHRAFLNRRHHVISA
jgi:hypothetical protein